MQLAPPGYSPWVRELSKLGLDIMEPFLAPIPFVWQGKKMVVVPIFDRVHKDWFDVCLCLWIVKTVVLPGLDMTLLARHSFSFLRSFMSAVSPDVRYFHVIS